MVTYFFSPSGASGSSNRRGFLLLHMLKSIFTEYLELGLEVIPIQWDTKTKQPVSHRRWGDGSPLDLYDKHNALMVHTSGDTHCLDFDIKNTKDKNLYHKWFNIVASQQPDIIGKLYIERTRNNGYHIWFKYPKDLHKLSLADSEQGNEVIALYAGGPLVYTYPTPGYDIVSGSMADLQEITDEEFNYMVQTSQYFNEYKPTYDPSLKAVSYPEGREEFCLNFDKNISEDAWIMILAEVGLVPLPDYKYKPTDKFVAFRRSGSASNAISAKVYFHTRRVMIFSASMHQFPNWHNKHEYPVWSLPPSFVLFYKHNRDWQAAFNQMEAIANAEGITIEEPYQTDYPLHVFPDRIRRSIIDVCNTRALAPQFVATAGLWTISSLAGARYISDFNGEGKNILFCLMVAPVSVGKTPAFKVMCDTPLQRMYQKYDQDFNEMLTKYEQAKDAGEKPGRYPKRFIPIANDGTTEGYTQKSMTQRNGIGVYQDEAETIFNAGNFKATNDSISFFTQAFSGGRNTQIRADEARERIVPNMNLNLLMGSQPSRIKNIFTEDRLASGFASRFLMVESDYIELRTDTDPFDQKKEMCAEWVDILNYLFRKGAEYNNGLIEEQQILITEPAKALYRKYYRVVLEQANTRIKTKAEGWIMGAEAKMSAYMPRLMQVVAIMHNPGEPVITDKIVQYGWDLYSYYSQSTLKIISSLYNEIETGLPKDLELLYQALPDKFNRKEASEVCIRLNMPGRKFDNAIRGKQFSLLFYRPEYGVYAKK